MNELIKEKIALNAQILELDQVIRINKMQIQILENGIKSIDRIIDETIRSGSFNELQLVKNVAERDDLEYSLQRELAKRKIPLSTEAMLTKINAPSADDLLNGDAKGSN